MMLKANFLLRATAGATLCQNPETGAYALVRPFPLALADGESLSAGLESLVKEVDNLIRIVLSHCAASEEAVNYVAANIDRILVSGNGTLRTLEEVREISLAIVQRGVAGAADILG